MLLFLAHYPFRETPPLPHRVTSPNGNYTRVLLAAGLFVCFWCCLRLFGTRGAGFALDAVLAVPCLVLGLAVVLRTSRQLRAERRGARAESLRRD
jgi:hypothetical protein